MKPVFHMGMLKPKSSKAVDVHAFTKQAENVFKYCLPERWWQLFSGTGNVVLMVKFMQKGVTVTSEMYCETLKSCVGPLRTIRRGMLASNKLVVLLHENEHPDRAARTCHYWSISSGNCLTTLFTTLISPLATTTCLLTWSTGCDHSASAVMRSWWELPKCGWAHRRQVSLTQAHKDLFPDTKKVHQFRWCLRWEIAQVCTYYLYEGLSENIASYFIILAHDIKGGCW
jgi:hypothetical protein